MVYKVVASTFVDIIPNSPSLILLQLSHNTMSTQTPSQDSQEKPATESSTGATHAPLDSSQAGQPETAPVRDPSTDDSTAKADQVNNNQRGPLVRTHASSDVTRGNRQPIKREGAVFIAPETSQPSQPPATS
ncbi:hypothetical protein FA95DRAFT_1027224 [Auriscalpium vulgare]|uniref:Uncharacterized protein n=1 Tax=Auriscalpium vulgare TaxID=40419 RepID=A0ACB8R780_9AGAM|nr:hypothetical protein FA95DRAFT_1027224 [Auriscalpium vulgare]